MPPRHRSTADLVGIPRRVIINRPGPSQDFRPLPTARRVEDFARSWGESIVQFAPPKTLSEEVRVLNVAAIVSPAQVIADTIPIVQLQLPIAMPVAIQLGAWEDDASVARLPLRLPAFASSTSGAFATAFFFVQWGQGKARNYTATDLAPGSLQIPSAQWVSVGVFAFDSAQAPGTGLARATAALWPGEVAERPDATNTAVVEAINSNPVFIAGTTSYARDLTAYFASTATGAGPTPGLKITARDASTAAIGQWFMQTATPGNPGTIPSALTSVPIGGNVNSYTAAFSTNGVETSRATLVQTIRI